MLRAFARGLARIALRLRLPYRPLARFDRMLDERDAGSGFFARWRDDPCVLRTVTARYLASMLGTAPPIAFDDPNRRTPILVVNPQRDRMVVPALTAASAARLAGPKRLVDIPWGHFSLRPEFTELLAGLGDDWFRRHAPSSSACAGGGALWGKGGMPRAIEHDGEAARRSAQLSPLIRRHAR